MTLTDNDSNDKIKPLTVSLDGRSFWDIPFLYLSNLSYLIKTLFRESLIRRSSPENGYKIESNASCS